MFNIHKSYLLTFLAIALFYAFESAQMAYFNVLAPGLISQHIYSQHQVGAISAAYYYGDMAGLFPVGFALDRWPLRKTLLWALLGSLLGAWLLFASAQFEMQWAARFVSGFCGGTFSFLGGIRLIVLLFPKRFSYWMGVFLAFGMAGEMICQYPLLEVVRHFGTTAAMQVMFAVGVVVIGFNFVWMRPPLATHQASVQRYTGTRWQWFKEIVGRPQNWGDVLMVVLLDTPVSMLGTLWGVVLLMNFFAFSAAVSAGIVMVMFLGLIIGLPIWGAMGDKYHHPAWVLVVGAGLSAVMGVLLLWVHGLHQPWLVGVLFLGLGFFSSCQTQGFAWLTHAMRPELIGSNSAFNSMIFMAGGGGVKQLGAYVLALPMLWMAGHPAGNLLWMMVLAMVLATGYALLRGRWMRGLTKK